MAAVVVALLYLGPVWVAIAASSVSLRAGGVALAAWLIITSVLAAFERRWRSRPAVVQLIPSHLWVVLPWLGSCAGTIKAFLPDLARGVGFVVLPVGLVVALAWGSRTVQLVVVGICLAMFLVAIVMATARRHVIVGEFVETRAEDTGDGSATAVDLADLLRGEIARLADLLHVVGDRRAVNSGLAEQSALDATLSVDELSDFFKGPVIAESTVKLAGITLPLAPFLQLAGRLVSSPRITGRLHRDADLLILTAQTTRGRRVTWRVDGSLASTRRAENERETRSALPAVRADMVRELSLRIYTDLALDQRVRWMACQHFVEGLRFFRFCLRTPKDRKVNLRRAENAFLDALAEDEDFPLAYYNLGIVYTELLGLAEVAGRREEAEMRLSAAETSFGRAIEKAPGRWDCHFAFAQTQLRREHHAVVVGLCQHMLRWSPISLLQQARTRELLARAYENGQPALAQREARRAVELGLRHLMAMRLRRQSRRSADDLRADHAADVVSACLLTYGSSVVSNELRAGLGRRDQARLRRHIARIASMLSRLGDSRAEFQHFCGCQATKIGDFELAAEQLEHATRSVPTRPDYAAEHAWCLAKQLERHPPEELIEDGRRDQVLSPVYRALQAMAGTFFPARDVDACRRVAEVFRVLAQYEWAAADDAEETPADSEMSQYFNELADALQRKLKEQSNATSTSGLFLQELQGQNVKAPDKLRVAKLVGPYGQSAHGAYEALVRGQEKKYPPSGPPALEDRSYVADFQSALRCAYQATSLNPLSTFAWETQGDIFAEFLDFENARESWQRALLTDPDNPHLYDKIGLSHWNLAFQGGARVSLDSLERAREHFEAALDLHGSDYFGPRILTHYRLAKLSAAMGDLPEARKHVQIVESAGDGGPLVGWVLLGLALLARSRFSECEYYFQRVTTIGRDRANAIEDPLERARWTLGDRLDEWLWPLALTRAWGHVGLALSWVERQGTSRAIENELEAAEALLATLYQPDEDPVSHVRYPTRLPAAIAEVKGRLPLLQPHSDLVAVTQLLEEAISRFPYSRTYVVLADVLERRSRTAPEDDADALRVRAEALRKHAEAFRAQLANGSGRERIDHEEATSVV
jgi:tetratricopeptide (TPR) repeat protein